MAAVAAGGRLTWCGLVMHGQPFSQSSRLYAKTGGVNHAQPNGYFSSNSVYAASRKSAKGVAQRHDSTKERPLERYGTHKQLRDIQVSNTIQVYNVALKTACGALHYSNMPRIRRSKRSPPDGWELIEPVLDELDGKMREGW